MLGYINFVFARKHCPFYNSLLKCHLDYCQPIWGNCPASLRRGFPKLQKTAVRNISLSSYNHHSEPLFKKFKILKYDDLLTYNSAVLMFNLTMGKHPPPITNIFSRGHSFDRNMEYVIPLVP